MSIKIGDYVYIIFTKKSYRVDIIDRTCARFNYPALYFNELHCWISEHETVTQEIWNSPLYKLMQED